MASVVNVEKKARRSSPFRSCMENDVHRIIRKAGFHYGSVPKMPEHTPGRFIANADVPTSINDNSGIRLLLSKNEIQRLANVLQIVGRQPPIAIGRHKARCDVQGIPLLKRQI